MKSVKHIAIVIAIVFAFIFLIFASSVVIDYELLVIRRSISSKLTGIHIVIVKDCADKKDCKP